MPSLEQCKASLDSMIIERVNLESFTIWKNEDALSSCFLLVVYNYDTIKEENCVGLILCGLRSNTPTFCNVWIFIVRF